jgi:AcrR family transcriptional regulator
MTYYPNMARPKKTTTEDIVYRATRHLWQYGYADSSLGSLEEATGVGRKGLYNEFGSKLGLLTACLRYYRTTLVAPYFAALEAPEAALDAVKSTFSKLVFEWSDEFPAGCMVCNVSREDVANRPEVAKEIDAYWVMCRSRFSHGIGNAQLAGEIDKRIDKDAASLYLLTLLQGVCVMEKSSADLGAMPSVVDIAMAGLRC